MNPKTRIQTWYSVTCSWYPSNWPVIAHVNVLAKGTLDLKRILIDDVFKEAESFHVRDIRQMGSIEDYRKQFGVDGQLDIDDIPFV